MRTTSKKTGRRPRVPGEPDADGIVRVTTGEVRRMKGRTDWARVDATTDDDIARQIAEDPDTAPDLSGDEWAARAVVVRPPRAEQIALRVPPDVLAFFRTGGKGYQSRMVAVLRAYVEHHTRGAKKGESR